ncbi:hypothetical protein AB0N09_18250, partial [Streptomyces erythrochromogenes]|uniref:hypothetical protein n=1 Tax=Streptomyces erythrochromogenes TaxID=285574 RepID=UPI003443CAB6
ALIFGTLLSSQGTDASFVLTLSNIGWGFPPGFRSAVLRFRLYQTLSCPTSSVLSRFSLSRFPFRRFRLYQILSVLIPSQRVVLRGLLGPCGE